MKRISLLCGFAVLAASLSAVTVSDVTIRQDWPWSPRIEVTYTLRDVTSAVDIRVEMLDGATSMGVVPLPDGECRALTAAGTYKLSFVIGAATERKMISQFKVRLTPIASDPSWNFPLYKVVDLVNGGVSAVTPAMIISGQYGSWKWQDESATTIDEDGKVNLANLIWTGVAEGDVYKTDKLVVRYLDAEGDEGRMYHQDRYTMPEDFYIAVFETTQKQWENVCGAAASCHSKGDTLPVESITYNAVRGADESSFWPRSPASDSFLGLLRTKADSVAFDLPAVYQLNYACMARSLFETWKNSTVEGWNDNTPVDGPVPGQLGSGTTAVGSFPVSTLGLYDLIGNVKEMCVDYYKSGQTQTVQKGLGATVNVNLEDPTLPLNPAAEKLTTRATLSSAYSTGKSSCTLNSARGCQGVGSSDSTVGFRVICPAEAFEGTSVALTEVTSGESAEAQIWGRADQSFLWSTAPAGDFAVTWAFPENGSPATLTVTGMGGYSETYANLTGTSQELTLPAASKYDENVYELTLTFADGSQKTARLARVYGDAAGDTSVARCVPPTNKRWHYALDKNVLPIPFGAGTLTVDGTPVETGLAGAAGWYGLGLSAAEGAKSVSLTVDDVTYENELVLPNGLLLLIH